MFPSSIQDRFSLTACDASSIPLRPKIMPAGVVVLVPLVIAYQVRAYSRFSGKVTLEDLMSDEAY